MLSHPAGCPDKPERLEQCVGSEAVEWAHLVFWPGSNVLSVCSFGILNYSCFVLLYHLFVSVCSSDWL